MSRYFIEVAYKGTAYSGFQIQKNSNTVQAEIEKAINIIFGFFNVQDPIANGFGVKLTGSSRTDAGVHALQNFFHFDTESLAFNTNSGTGGNEKQFLYKMNSILPADIVIKRVFLMPATAHSRFDAVGREYEYHIYSKKNPFIKDVAFYYPYKIDRDLINQAAEFILNQTNFYAFTKTNTQNVNFECIIRVSNWFWKEDVLIYTIHANRFLRGMVRLLTASMLQVGRKKISLQEFQDLFNGELKCGFSVPPQGLFLKAVTFPEKYFS